MTKSQFIALTDNSVLQWDMAVQNVPHILMKHKQIQINISETNFFDGMSIFYSNQEVNGVVGALGLCSAHSAVLLSSSLSSSLSSITQQFT